MDSSIIQGPFSVAPCQTLISRFATFSSLCTVWGALFSAGVGDAAALEDAAVEEALRNLRRELETEDDQRTAMKKSRIVRLGFGTARQKRVLE